ncbi:hypothetical protein ABZ464_48650 [Streptomyces sp. NPDC005820]|uniref:hypothetical protein n=1 Tax=Streptomyces sp. NPDC005820 TaxID=3157069 RepID=UPI0033F552E6
MPRDVLTPAPAPPPVPRRTEVTRGVRGSFGILAVLAVTVAVHPALGRRTILGVGAGTAVYLVLLNTL